MHVPPNILCSRLHLPCDIVCPRLHLPSHIAHVRTFLLHAVMLPCPCVIIPSTIICALETFCLLLEETARYPHMYSALPPFSILHTHRTHRTHRMYVCTYLRPIYNHHPPSPPVPSFLPSFPASFLAAHPPTHLHNHVISAPHPAPHTPAQPPQLTHPPIHPPALLPRQIPHHSQSQPTQLQHNDAGHLYESHSYAYRRYVHTYIHIHIHACMQACSPGGLQPGMRVSGHAGMLPLYPPIYLPTSMPIHPSIHISLTSQLISKPSLPARIPRHSSIYTHVPYIYTISIPSQVYLRYGSVIHIRRSAVR